MKLTSLTLVSALITSAIAQSAPFKIDFKVRRGSSRNDLTPADEDSSPRFVKRDGSFEMVMTNQQTFYMANLKIGSNEDENDVLVDTGSSDLWVMSHDLNCVSVSNSRRFAQTFDHTTGAKYKLPLNKRDAGASLKPSKTSEDKEVVDAQNKLFGTYSTVYITEGGSLPSGSPFIGTGDSGSNTCTSYGSFNTGNSDTFRENDTYPFLIEYADNTHAIGVWGYDNVIINNVTVRDLSFAIANETSSDVGVLGIGLPGLEVTSQYGYIYANLPIKLAQEGIINRAIYSLYLDTADAETGSILFGAIDHAKYEGDLVTLNMMRTYSQISYPVRIQVPVSDITYSGSNGDSETVLSSTTGVVLDTGSTLSYVFSDTLRSLGQALDGSYSSSVGAYVVDCNLKSSSNTLDINFGGNKTIQVPISDLVLQYTRSQCILGVLQQSSSSSYMLFGDNILRSAYIVYDIEDYQVSLAQVVYTDKESIEIIGADGISNTTGTGSASDSLSGSSSSSTSSSTTSSRSRGAAAPGPISGLSSSVQGLFLSLLAWVYFMV